MKTLLLTLVLLFGATSAWAQQASPFPATPVQATPGFYSQIAISATAAVNNQTTLTIPAPTGGAYNYICYLGFNASQSVTGAELNNQVTTSTNFNSFALKFSISAHAVGNSDYDWAAHWGTPVGGCVKSAASGTATTFVSPTAAAQTAFTWYATYFQAP